MQLHAVRLFLGFYLIRCSFLSKICSYFEYKIQLSAQNGKPEDHIDDNALPKEDPSDEDPDKELKKNLMFEQKNISDFKLYCHLMTS